MYFLLRLSPILFSLFAAAVLLFTYYQPAKFFSLIGTDHLTMPMVVALTIISTFVLMLGIILIGSSHSFKARFRFMPFLVVSWISGLMLFLFSDHKLILWGVIIVLPIMIWIWLESLFLFWQQSATYQAYTLQKIARYLYIIEIFLLATALVGAQVLLQVKVYIIAPLAIIIFWLMQYDYFLLHKFDVKESLILSLMGTILAGQLYIVLNFLPTNFFMHGLLIAMFFYVWLGICRQIMQRQPDLRATGIYVVLGGVGACVGFISSLLI